MYFVEFNSIFYDALFLRLESEPSKTKKIKTNIKAAF